MDIIEKINSLYSSQFNTLLWMMGIFVAFLGIVVPVLYYLLQQRLLRIERENIEDEMRRELNTLKEELKKENEASIDKRFENQEKLIQKEIFRIEAGIFHVQANFYLSLNQWSSSVLSFLNAIIDDLACEGWVHLKLMITNLKVIMNRNDSSIYDNHFDERFTILIDTVRKMEGLNDYIKADIDDLAKDYKSAKERKQKS